LPAIQINVERISRLVGRKLAPSEVAALASSLGLSVEEVGDEYVKAEYNPNRPDFGCHPSLARAFKGLLGIESGARRYSARQSSIAVMVERSVALIRPYIACAVIRSPQLGEDDIADLVALQEDLHWILGRGRRKVAIGIHDYSRIEPPFTYKAVGLSDIRFIPLGSHVEMTPREILEGHPTGRKYAWILQGSGEAPIIIDSRGNVLSFPPIINSSLTELRPGVEELFVDVTGTDERAVNLALNIISTTLADMGGTVYKTRISYWGGRTVETPGLSSTRMYLDPDYTCSLLGVTLKASKVARTLRRMRLNARAVRGRVLVEIPPYRIDILHPVDLVEEVAIGVGYENLTPTFPATHGLGSLLHSTRIMEVVRQLLLGMGFTEVVNTTLSNSERDYKWMMRPGEPSIKILNPLSALYDTLRDLILPSLLSNLAYNTKNPYPQRIFELGDVIMRQDALPEKAGRETHLALATCHSTASYSEAKSFLEEVLRLLEMDLRLEAREYPFFIRGRAAAVLGGGGEEVGFIGEVSPQVLENFNLYMPVAACELSLTRAGFLP